MSRRRVVVTGVGLVTPLSALGARETWKALLDCRTGVRVLKEDDMPEEHRRELSQLPCRIAARVDDEEFARSRWCPPWWPEWQSKNGSGGGRGGGGGGGGGGAAKEESDNDDDNKSLPRFASRAAAFAAAAAAEALDDAGIDLTNDGFYHPSRVAVSVGVGMPAVRAAALAGGELSAAARGEEGKKNNALLLPLLSPPTARLLRDSATASGPASLLAESLGVRGPIFAPSTACAAGASAVADAFEAVASGAADAAVAGGAEACVDAVTLAAFSRMRALCTDSNGDGDGGTRARRASRPFGVGRCGFVVGEGAGVVVLEAAEAAAERARRRRGQGRQRREGGGGGRGGVRAIGAYCELRGAGVSADAHHAAQPRETGDGAAAAMREALSVSGIRASQVSHVSAHATSTPAGDAAEAAALASVFFDDDDDGSDDAGAGGEKQQQRRRRRQQKAPVVVSGVKAAIGHLLGAAGAVEAALAVAALADGRAPPTATLGGAEEGEGGGGGAAASAAAAAAAAAVGVDERGFVIARARRGGVPLRPSSSSPSSSGDNGLVALSNSFGFGGANVCLAFSSPPGARGVRARKWREEKEEEKEEGEEEA